MRMSFGPPDPPEHEHHFCERKEVTEVKETYPCGTRRVYNTMVGTCCMCRETNTFWGGNTLREPGEPDQAYGTF